MRLKDEDIPICEVCRSEDTYQNPMMTTRPSIICPECGHRFLVYDEKFVGL